MIWVRCRTHDEAHAYRLWLWDAHRIDSLGAVAHPGFLLSPEDQ